MSTILERMIGAATVIKSEKLIGRQGKKLWTKNTLSDGRVAFYGPDNHGRMPDYVRNHCPQGQRIIRAGGTTYEWSGWITERTV